MSSSVACSTLLFAVDPEDVTARYEAGADPADGYLTRAGDVLVLTDALATDTADWARQTQLATLVTAEGGVALSAFLNDRNWALALADSGKAGPMAVCVPEDEEVLKQLPFQLMELEQGLLGLFPGLLDAEEIDSLFGAMVEGAVGAEEGIGALLAMLGVAPDWLRWSWYDTLPQQLFLDPDLAARVTPLGSARALWEE